MQQITKQPVDCPRQIATLPHIMRLIICALLTLIVAATAAASEPERNYAIPGDTECPLKLPEDGNWTDAEKWAWEQICLGKLANMRYALPSKDKDYRSRRDDSSLCDPWADPKNTSTIPSHRFLSPAFLSFILTREPWVSAPLKPQVNIACAVFKKTVDLENVVIEPELWLYKTQLQGGVTVRNAHFKKSLGLSGSQLGGAFNADGLTVGGGLFLRGGATFEQGVRLLGAKIVGNLEADGSTFTGVFNADGLTVGGDLFLHGRATFEQEVRLLGAKIGGQVSASGSTFTGVFNADGLTVGGGLFLHDGATFGQEVRLPGAKIGGQVSASGSTFTGVFNADGLTVGGSLFLRGGATFEQGVELLGAKIVGNLEADGSIFKGVFNADRLTVGGSLFLRGGATFGQEVRLPVASIEGSLQLFGSCFHGEFDFSGGKADELMLYYPSSQTHCDKGEKGHDDAIWRDNAALILRNAEVEAVQSRPASWQYEDEGERWMAADLSGFTYKRLAGLLGHQGETMADAKADTLILWLEGTAVAMGKLSEGGTRRYDPLPYEQLAHVLEKNGRINESREIHYEKFLHREDFNAASWSDTWLWGAVIGYGVYPFRALWWFFGLVIFGFCVASESRAKYLNCPHSSSTKLFFRPLWYSLDMAIPLISLSENHKKVTHQNIAIESWFHLQAVLGFGIASILVGALLAQVGS